MKKLIMGAILLLCAQLSANVQSYPMAKLRVDIDGDGKKDVLEEKTSYYSGQGFNELSITLSKSGKTHQFSRILKKANYAINDEWNRGWCNAQMDNEISFNGTSIIIKTQKGARDGCESSGELSGSIYEISLNKLGVFMLDKINHFTWTWSTGDGGYSDNFIIDFQKNNVNRSIDFMYAQDTSEYLSRMEKDCSLELTQYSRYKELPVCAYPSYKKVQLTGDNEITLW